MNQEKIIKLKNKKGKSLILLLRKYQEGDEAGMIACIRDEYKDSYFKRNFYQPEFIRKEAKEHGITFLVAQTMSGEIAGMLLLKHFYPEESMCEIASEIFRKEYRGYGLATPFLKYGMEIVMTRFYSAAYCLPVLFHSITQVLLWRLGLCATGMILNVFDLLVVTHSYDNGRNTKHSQGVQIMALGKTNTGLLYLPVEHQGFCRAIYENLGVTYYFFNYFSSNDKNRKERRKIEQWKEMPKNSEITYNHDEKQSNLEIQVHGVGADFKKRIKELQSKFPLVGKQTANVFLNCNDKYAPKAYKVLKAMGYFFTGLKPLCSKNEYIILHNPGEVQIYFEDYVVSEEFAPIITYVKECYEKR